MNNDQSSYKKAFNQFYQIGGYNFNLQTNNEIYKNAGLRTKARNQIIKINKSMMPKEHLKDMGNNPQADMRSIDNRIKFLQESVERKNEYIEHIFKNKKRHQTVVDLEKSRKSYSSTQDQKRSEAEIQKRTLELEHLNILYNNDEADKNDSLKSIVQLNYLKARLQEYIVSL